MDVKPLTEGHPTLPNLKLRTINDSNMAVVRISIASDRPYIAVDITMREYEDSEDSCLSGYDAV